MLDFYYSVYRVKLLSFQKDGIVEIPFHDLLPFVDYHLVYDTTQRGLLLGQFYRLAKAKYSLKWSTSVWIAHHDMPSGFQITFPSISRRDSISPPMVSPPLHPKATHLPCASLKPKNIIKLQRRKKKRVGGLSVCVLRVFEIKKLWQKQQQQQALGHRWSLDLILYGYLSKREIILICCVVIPIHLVSFQYEPYHKLKYAKSFINISEVFISL